MFENKSRMYRDRHLMEKIQLVIDCHMIMQSSNQISGFLYDYPEVIKMACSRSQGNSTCGT